VEDQFKQSGKIWDDEVEQEKLREFLLGLRGQVLPSESESNDESQILDLVPAQEEDLGTYRAFWNTRAGLFTLREAMQDILIRRDDRSKDPNGKPLLGLRPVIDTVSYLKLDEKTEAALKQATATKEHRSVPLIADRTHAYLISRDIYVEIRQKPCSHGLRCEHSRVQPMRHALKTNELSDVLQGFFTGLKKILVHPILMQSREPGVSAEEHVRQLFPTLESYRSNRSPKLDRVLHLAGHHLGEKNAKSGPLFWDVEGNLCERDEPIPRRTEPEGDVARRKMVVYCHLSQSWTLVTHVSIPNRPEGVRALK
jgi:hypothetical protein